MSISEKKKTFYRPITNNIMKQSVRIKINSFTLFRLIVIYILLYFGKVTSSKSSREQYPRFR